jgi:uncharacterized protein (DUF488 family)
LEDAGVDLFLDVRQRRGMRGSKYAFANSGQLIPALESRRIEYLHLRELAPPTEIRKLQRDADAATATAKSLREELSDAFVAAYADRVLARVDWPRLARRIGEADAPVLFCVERRPEACHRSLIAVPLAAALGSDVRTLQP